MASVLLHALILLSLVRFGVDWIAGAGDAVRRRVATIAATAIATDTNRPYRASGTNVSCAPMRRLAARQWRPPTAFSSKGS